MIRLPFVARVVAIAAVVCSLATAAHAADSPAAQADALIAEGYKLRVQGKKLEALDLFMKAHALDPSGRTLGQIGSVEVALGRWVEAERHIEEALARHDGPWIEAPKNREMLETNLREAREHVARIQIHGTPGAAVYVNSQRAGVLPLAGPVHIVAGTVTVKVSATGFQPFTKEVAAQGGMQEDVAAQLLPLVSPAPSATTPVAEMIATPEASRSSARVWTGASLVAAGAAAVGLGIGWLVVDGGPACTAPSGTVCQYLYDTKTQGWLAVGLGAVAAGAGVAIILWPTRSSPVAFTAGPRSLALAGRF